MVKDSIAALLKEMEKKYDLRVGPLSAVAEEVEVLPTGDLAIDYITGVGGLPLGRSVELFGLPSSGKTTTGLQAAALLQQRIIREDTDDLIVYMDYEHALDRKYAANLGLNVEHPSFLIAQPDNLEQGTNVSLELIETGKVRLVVTDSVAAMTPVDVVNGEVGQVAVATQARLMSTYLKKLTPLLSEHRTCGVFLNHEMELFQMGGARRPGMPAPTSTPGGKALKFYASVRIQYRQIRNIKAKVYDPLSGGPTDRVESTMVRVKVVKNKVAPPFRECIVRVRFGRGFDSFWSALQALIGHKRIVYRQGYYYFDKFPELVEPTMARSATQRPYVHGEAAMLQFADAHPEWRDLVIRTATEIVDMADEHAFDTQDAAEEEAEDAVPSLVGEESVFS